MAHFLSPLLQSPECVPVLRNQRTGQALATTLESAFDSNARRRGLLGRETMPAGSGLVIAPCSSVHTFFMRFAIDIIFAARDGRVIKVRRRVAPWRIAAALGAFAVIELPSGSLDESAIAVGDSLQIVIA
jgi:uncharacterized membrane protein (UPF0127 family)